MKFRVISNAIWMMSEKIVSIFGIIFVTSYVAKIFGPSVFGQITFFASLFSIVQSIAIFGSETILFKHLSENIPKGLRLTIAARKMRLIIFFLISLPVLGYILCTMQGNSSIFCLAFFIASLFITQDTFSVYNNVQLASRLNTIANSTGMLLGFAISFTIAWRHLNPFWLALSIVAVTLLPYLIKRYTFYRKNSDIRLSWKCNKNYFRYLFLTGLPLAISGTFISIQVKLAQFFLAGTCSPAELGLFAAANTISSSWIFIPSAIITSFFSEIFRVESGLAMKLTARLNGYVMAISGIMISFIILGGGQLITLLYGKDYTESGTITILLSVATAFSAMGTVAYRYIVKEGGFNYLLIKIIALMLFSLPGTFFLVSQFGLTGAAWSVLLTELASLTVMNYFFQCGVIKNIHILSLKYKTYQ